MSEQVNIPSCFSLEEWQALERQFHKDYNMYNTHIKSFNDLINEILQGETEGTFANKTGLSMNMFSRIRNYVSKKDQPQRNTLMSVCVGYNLDYQLTAKLFESLGVGFSLNNERDYAYQFLLTNCRGKSVDECNEILEQLGIEKKYWLGIHARR